MVRARTFAVLCVNGAAYEEWVSCWDARGRKAWASRAADTQRVFTMLRKLETEGAAKARIAAARARTPFGRLARETKVGLWKLVDPDSGAPLPRWTGGWAE